MTRTVLKMTFDPATIEHLGVQMYSTLPPVVAELVSNAYDADATIAEIYLKDGSNNKEIIVKDDGVGMSFDDINEKFLRIGRNRRSEENSQITAGGRKVIGKKGLGKLSFFGIANEIEVITRKGGKENSFLMKWDDIKNQLPGKNTNPRLLARTKTAIQKSTAHNLFCAGYIVKPRLTPILCLLPCPRYS